MAFFRKKPVVIEAVQWNGKNVGEVLNLLDTGHLKAGIENGNVVIHTLEGIMVGDVGDWIIRGVKGECYPCKPDIFEMTYEITCERSS